MSDVKQKVEQVIRRHGAQGWHPKSIAYANGPESTSWQIDFARGGERCRETGRVPYEPGPAPAHHDD